MKLDPGDDILEALEKFMLDTSNKITTCGFVEFRLIGSVWADSIEYGISQDFGDIKSIVPYNDFTPKEREIANKARRIDLTLAILKTQKDPSIKGGRKRSLTFNLNQQCQDEQSRQAQPQSEKEKQRQGEDSQGTRYAYEQSGSSPIPESTDPGDMGHREQAGSEQQQQKKTETKTETKEEAKTEIKKDQAPQVKEEVKTAPKTTPPPVSGKTAGSTPTPTTTIGKDKSSRPSEGSAKGETGKLDAPIADKNKIPYLAPFGLPATEAKQGLTAHETANRKKLEVLFCWGTVSWEFTGKASDGTALFNQPKAHAHIMFSDSKGVAFGGHLVRAKIAIVGEVILDVLTTKKAVLGDKN